MFLFYPLKKEKFNQNVIHWTITLITPLLGIVHFKTNYNYRLSNHCLINELILVTYALISNAVEKTDIFMVIAVFDACKCIENVFLEQLHVLLCFLMNLVGAVYTRFRSENTKKSMLPNAVL